MFFTSSMNSAVYRKQSPHFLYHNERCAKSFTASCPRLTPAKRAASVGNTASPRRDVLARVRIGHYQAARDDRGAEGELL
jgi:hypothetical protein